MVVRRCMNVLYDAFIILYTDIHVFYIVFSSVQVGFIVMAVHHHKHHRQFSFIQYQHATYTYIQVYYYIHHIIRTHKPTYTYMYLTFEQWLKFHTKSKSYLRKSSYVT